MNNGIADEITLSNGKKFYTGCSSYASKCARDLGLKIKHVKFKGSCIAQNIMERAHAKTAQIEIDGVDIYTFIDEVAQEYDEIK